MEYVLSIILSVILVIMLWLKMKKDDKKEKGNLETIKQTVIISILTNTFILTGLIIGREGIKPFDIIFLWIINFIIPLFGFQRVFRE